MVRTVLNPTLRCLSNFRTVVRLLQAGYEPVRKRNVIRNDFESTVLRHSLYIPENETRFTTNAVRGAGTVEVE